MTVWIDRLEPGNGTLYEVGLVGTQENDRLVLVWLNAYPCGKSFAFDVDNFLHFTYLMEKLDIRSESDATALLAYLADKTGVDVGLP